MNLRELFYLNKSDRRVVLFLLILAAVALCAILFMGRGEETTALSQQDSIDNVRGARGKEHGARRRWGQGARSYRNGGYQGYYGQGSPQQAEPFAFDPNTADSTTLLRLGLAPWVVRNIYRYRAKGGQFRQPEDFAQLYGLTKQQYDRLKPYIRISADYLPAADFVKSNTESSRDTVRYPVKLLPTEFIVLNKADTTQLKKVPGIGSGWARRIISYGERLGGYVDVMQLTEMDGFPPEALNFFIVEDPQPRKINLNTLTVNQLRRHPYINFYQARAIHDYRRLKGPLESLDQLKLLKDFPPEALERLAPYVEF